MSLRDIQRFNQANAGVCPCCDTSWSIHDGPCVTEQEKADARALWAVRVLDRWAFKKNRSPEPSHSWRTDCVAGEYPWECHLMRRDATVESWCDDCPDAARIAAAEALVAEDPTLGEGLS